MDKDDIIKLWERVIKGSSQERIDRANDLADKIIPLLIQPALLITTARTEDPSMAEEITIMFVSTLMLTTSKNVDEAIITLKKIYKTFTETDKEINKE